jgi:hypothetical protein
MDLVAAYEYVQVESAPAGSPDLRGLGITAPESTDDSQHTQPEWDVQRTSPDLELSDHASHAEERLRLLCQVRNLQGHLHVLQDEVSQANAELAREKRHSDLKIGIAMQKIDSKIVGYSNGQVVYQTNQTAEERHYELYGTKESIGPGPYAYGSWINWGNPSNRSPTPKEVAEWQAQLKAKADATAEAKAARVRELKRPLGPGEAARIMQDVASLRRKDLRRKDPDLLRASLGSDK